MATPPYDGYVVERATVWNEINITYLDLYQISLPIPLTFATSMTNPHYCLDILNSHYFSLRLPDHVSFDEGAMCEPLSVGVHAVSRANISLGQTVLITGAGMRLNRRGGVNWQRKRGTRNRCVKIEFICV